jgi:hypothetical protein
MEVGRVKILGKVENLVCRILHRFSTEIIIWFDVLDDRGKCEDNYLINKGVYGCRLSRRAMDLVFVDVTQTIISQEQTW